MPRPRKSSKPALSESWGMLSEESGGSFNADADGGPATSSTLWDSNDADDDGLWQDVPAGGAEPSRGSGKKKMRASNVVSTGSPAKRASRSSSSTVNGPEFIMPSMYSDHMNGSRMRTSVTQQRPKRRGSETPSTLVDSPKMTTSKVSQKARKRRDPKSHPGFSRPTLIPSIAWDYILFPVLRFILDTFAMSLEYLKPYIAYLIATGVIIAMAGMAISLGSTAVSASFSKAMSPLCAIPGMSYLSPTLCPPKQTPPPEFDRLVDVQATFEEILGSASGGVDLALDMKRSEASIRDLKHVIRFSTLPSRNELVFEFETFVTSAQQASMDLTRWNSHIGRSIDRVLNINRWTLRTLADVEEANASRGALSRFFSNSVLSTFTSQLTEKVVTDQYLRHIQEVQDQVASLIIEGQALQGILAGLEDRDDAIASILARDGVQVRDKMDELYSFLWTKLGGNKNSVSRLQEQLKLLVDATRIRKLSSAHVGAAVLQLQAIQAGLEDLRERVSLPENVGIRKDAPLWLHMQNIQLGVDRLEEQRQKTRRVDGDTYKRVLDNSNAELPRAKIEGYRPDQGWSKT